MHPSREKLSIRLDWVNVTYRSASIMGGVFALLVVAGMFAWGWRDTLGDLVSGVRRGARHEIAEARLMTEEASSYVVDARTGGLFELATAKLREAEDSFEQRKYQDSRTSAIVSQNNARKLIDIGRGDGAAAREARFYKFEGEVRVKRAGQFHWEGATQKTTLRIGDQIKTGRSGSAQIIYFDGTITTVRPESLLEIKDIFEEPTTRERRVRERLNWGEVEASTRKANVAGSFHEVQSDAASARSTSESEFRVTYDQTTGHGRIALFAGKVDVSTSTDAVTISGGEGISVDKGVLGQIEKLPPTPRVLSPSDQKIFVHASPQEASTTLAWERVQEAVGYRLQLSQKPLFADLLLDKADLRTSTVELPGLPVSSYYWRVASVDAAGASSPFSPARKFRVAIARFTEDGDRTPPPIRVEESILNGHYLIVSGQTEPGATLWVDDERIDVDDSGAFMAVVRLRREGANEVRVVSQDPSGNEARTIVPAFVEAF